MKDITKKKILILEIVLLILVSLFLLMAITTNSDLNLKFLNEKNQPPYISISVNISYGKAPMDISFNCFVYNKEDTIITYKWNFDDGSTSKIKNPTHTYINEGIYNVCVNVVDEKGLVGNDTITINVVGNIPPEAKAFVFPKYGLPPLKVNFKGEGIDSDGTIILYSWQFSGPRAEDSDYTAQRYSTRTYWRSGLYSATLTVTDNDGAIDRVTVNIWVYDILTAIQEFFSNIK